MGKWDNLTKDELRAIFRKPLSKEAEEQLREIDRQDAWLLALNFEEMDRQESDPDYDPANDPTCVRVEFDIDEE